MHELTVIRKVKGAYIESREIAEAVGKTHKHLLRDIRGYAAIMQKFGETKVGLTDFFMESTYVDDWNREKPCYLVSKMGCELIANKLIGERGVLFTAAYVTKFNDMETAEREAEIQSLSRPRLGEFNGAVRNVLNGLAYCFTSPKRIISFLRSVYEPFGIEIKVDGDDDNYFTSTEIAAQLEIYSETGNPHGHAVSAIISKLGDTANHSVAIPYGLVGVSLKYDRHIVNAVWDWIIANNFPCEVPYLNFFYHIYYDRRLSSLDYEYETKQKNRKGSFALSILT